MSLTVRKGIVDAGVCKMKYGLLSHKNILRKYQLMQPTYISNIGLCHDTVQFKRKTQSLCLFKDYRNAELTKSPCVYVDGPRNNMDMMDRMRCLHEAIMDCNY